MAELSKSQLLRKIASLEKEVEKAKFARENCYKAEDALKESEKKHKELFDAANDGIYILKATKKGPVFVHCNAKGLKLFGTSLKKILGMSPLDFSPSKQPDGIPSNKAILEMASAAMKGKSKTVEWVHRRADGKLFDAEVTVNPIRLDGHVFMQAIVRDVTDRKKTERALKESEEIFRGIVENSPSIIFIIDKDGNFTLSEGKGLEAIGLKPGQVVGTSALEMYKDYPTIIKGIKTALKGKVHKTVSFVQGIYYDTFYSPYKHADGSIAGLIGMAIDITDTKKAEQERLELFRIKELNELKDEFFSMTAHELKTPLTPIKIESDMWLSDRYGVLPERQEESMRIIERNCSRLIALVDDIQTLIKIRRERLPYNMRKVDLRGVLKDIGSDMNILAADKGISLHTSFSKTPLFVKGDRRRLMQVMSNLIYNAIKFTDKGKVTVSAKVVGKVIKVSVKDTGRGIPESEFDSIFSSYFKAKSVDAKSGLGLGLPIAKGIVEKHGGSIWCKSKLLEGSTFYFTLPKYTKK